MITYIIISTIGTSILAWFGSKAPMGHEDERGFHFEPATIKSNN